jgi:hypothetical protein
VLRSAPGHGFLTAAGLAHQDHVGFIGQDGGDAFSDQRMIVGA